MVEYFPNIVTVGKPANNNEFLQRNLSTIKFKLHYLTSWKLFFGTSPNGCV